MHRSFILCQECTFRNTFAGHFPVFLSAKIRDHILSIGKVIIISDIIPSCHHHEHDRKRCDFLVHQAQWTS